MMSAHKHLMLVQNIRQSGVRNCHGLREARLFALPGIDPREMRARTAWCAICYQVHCHKLDQVHARISSLLQESRCSRGKVLEGHGKDTSGSSRWPGGWILRIAVSQDIENEGLQNATHKDRKQFQSSLYPLVEAQG